MKPLTPFHAFLGRITPSFWRKSFGLRGLDLHLAAQLPLRNGFFIEAGANDGFRQSNTLYLEKYLGWTGLLVEPIPERAVEAALNRPRCRVESCALVSHEYTEPTVALEYYDLMTLVKDSLDDPGHHQRHVEKAARYVPAEKLKTVLAPAKTLTVLLDQLKVTRVDLLSLDVEGYEHEVLKGLDFARHRPRWILVEVRDQILMEAILAPWYEKVAVLSENENYRDVLYRTRDAAMGDIA